MKVIYFFSFKDDIFMHIAGTMDRGKLAMLRCEEAAHLQLVKAERIAYAKRMREAVVSNGDDVLSIAMDGADQGVYGIPYFAQVCEALPLSIGLKFNSRPPLIPPPFLPH